MNIWTLGYENVAWHSGVQENIIDGRYFYALSWAVKVPNDTQSVSLDGTVIPLIDGMIWEDPILFKHYQLLTRIRRFRSAAEDDLLVFENLPLVSFGNRIPVVVALKSSGEGLLSALGNSTK